MAANFVVLYNGRKPYNGDLNYFEYFSEARSPEAAKVEAVEDAHERGRSSIVVTEIVALADL